MAIPFWLTKLLVRTRCARFTLRGRRLADGGGAYLRYYSDRVLAAPVDELLDPAVVPDTPGPDIFDLNQPAPALELGSSLTRFTTGRWGSPRGSRALREALAERYRAAGRILDPDTDILVSHGATGAYAVALDALVNSGDRVVLFDPSSPLFSLGAKSRRAVIRWVPTRTEGGHCRFETRDLETAMRGAKLLVLADPANPTGGCLHEEDLDRIARMAVKHDVLVYADESFGPLRYEPSRPSLAAMSGAEGRVLTAGSMTPAFGLGALRIGWLAGSRHLVKACGLMANLEAPFIPAPCQLVAARALNEPEAALERTLDKLRGKRDYALERLRAMGMEADRPAGGYFLWVSVAGWGLDGRTFAQRLFRERQVQVGPGCAFGPSGGGFVRISLAADDGRLREGLARMAEFVQSLKTPDLSSPEPVGEEAPEPAAIAGPLPCFSRV